MATEGIAKWPDAGGSTGMYESFYLRVVSPDEPVSVWIRYTVQKAAGREPKASIWFTVFDESKGRPFARKFTTMAESSGIDPAIWIRVGESTMGPGSVAGSIDGASWSLEVSDSDLPLSHLPRRWMYRSPIPKTKPESPAPFARFSGRVECDGRNYELDGWPGMLGHNWGGEHAWTWVWLNGAAFAEDPEAWIDVVLGRVRVAGRLLPWVANGALRVNGLRHRIGGLPRRGVVVDAEPGRATMKIPGAGGRLAEVELSAPRDSTVAWTYASPDGHQHDVLNCSIAGISVKFTDQNGSRHGLSSDHGGTYELGLADRQDWLPLEPYADEW